MSPPARLLASAVSALSLLAPTTSAPQQPVFKAKVEAIRVDVLVTQDRRPMRGLGRDDFELFDNGVRQVVEVVEHFGDTEMVNPVRLPLNVVLALDTSDSVTGERLDQLCAASYKMIDGLEKNDRAALVTFNDVLSLAVPLTNDFGRVRQSIRGMRPSGATLLVDATYAGMVLPESDEGRNLLVLFTDGVDTGSFLRREAVIDTAKRTDVVVYAVAVAVPRRSSFLEDVTSQTGGRLFELDSVRDLPAVFAQILAEFRSRYVLSYSPRGVAPAGWHRIEVKVKNRRAAVKARAGYLAGK